MHGKEDPSVDWFKAIADVWECARDDNAHRVVQIVFAHFLDYFCWDDFADFHECLVKGEK
ncbi:MAG: hypothetical protein A3D26_02305 [Candidatus Blackburnbacteria bacterium RIFCSPHIGHO2_02_FULL_44_20]|uniref:Uncharacterized protein n=1 Tax=Candidatus Blackburnbacteria bacterium RIFCSPHIGHO2_02_FULL_44_20 TaxID=1797516 RepID=A0A1G1V792_9BACT|nr:MAG: hypothetical protein A3D26_02305 [Candidatus Blackburnbacteria bacterium RIFCSPHIGHO2_02_FULL_44_20]